MQFEVIPTEQFEKDVQYYLKKKKFKNVLDDIDEVVSELEKRESDRRCYSRIII